MKKRSKVVNRTVVCSITMLYALMSGCGKEYDDNDFVRNRYNSKEDCLKDYDEYDDDEGNANCEETLEKVDEKGNSSRTYRHHYFGPGYPYYYFYRGWFTPRYYPGRTATQDGPSIVASHVVNTEGHAIARTSIGTRSSLGGFARAGFGATAHGFAHGGVGG